MKQWWQEPAEDWEKDSFDRSDAGRGEAPARLLVRSRRRGAYRAGLANGPEDFSDDPSLSVPSLGGTDERPRSQALMEEALGQMPAGRPGAHRDMVRWRIPVGLVTVFALVLTCCALWSLLAGDRREEVVLAGSGASMTPSAVLPASTGGAVASAPVVPPASYQADAGARVKVHVAGAVAEPGVYEVPAGAIVQDAVMAAGGPLPEANTDALNLAETVVGGSQIYVPRLGESQPSEPLPALSAAPGGASATPALVNVNTADLAQLQELPKVGPVLAQNIVTWREQNGGFKSVDELQLVKGIGPATFELLRPLVTV